MKFKAVIENEGAGSASQAMLLHVLQAIQRLERAADRRGAGGAERRGGPAAPANVVLKLAPDTFAFCHRAGADEGSQTWSHFHVNRLFAEYRIESKRQNKVDLEASVVNLVHVFQSCYESDRTTIRLANGRDGRPILGFEFSLAGNVTDHRVEQEVPVRVIAEAEAMQIIEPALPEPEYQIELPNTLSRLKSLLDRMRQVGALHVTFEAARELTASAAAVGDAAAAAGPQGDGGTIRACLRLGAEAELVSITSTFPSLPLVMEGKKAPPPQGPVRLQLSLRRLSEVLAAFQTVSAEAHIACVLEGRALVLYALLPQSLGSLISYTPAIVT
eukprot:TRINITY_DN13357_c0_g1_i1.p1 TRINITY_DN13357_c0_g1~~TRINITY_DN13357_c0_g1_i1.p1  ORF type:complete len:330 (-),score=75.46 TRINITY_DN13357_c0_g1_i1:87-1076(-)